MSGYAEQDVLKKLKTNTAIHIHKPFTVDALLTRIAEALQGGSNKLQELAASSF